MQIISNAVPIKDHSPSSEYSALPLVLLRNDRPAVRLDPGSVSAPMHANNQQCSSN